MTFLFSHDGHTYLLDTVSGESCCKEFSQEELAEGDLFNEIQKAERRAKQDYLRALDDQLNRSGVRNG